MADEDIAVGELVDERRRGSPDGPLTVADDEDARERVRSYLVRAGCVRHDPETVWRFGRRVVGEAFLITEFGTSEGDDGVTLCLLPESGTVLFDRGGPLLENEYVAAFLDGYFEFYGGEYELHAQPFESAARLEDAVSELEAQGLVGGGAAGPFGSAFDRLSTGLDDRIANADG